MIPKSNLGSFLLLVDPVHKQEVQIPKLQRTKAMRNHFCLLGKWMNLMICWTGKTIFDKAPDQKKAKKPDERDEESFLSLGESKISPTTKAQNN